MSHRPRHSFLILATLVLSGTGIGDPGTAADENRPRAGQKAGKGNQKKCKHGKKNCAECADNERGKGNKNRPGEVFPPRGSNPFGPPGAPGTVTRPEPEPESGSTEEEEPGGWINISNDPPTAIKVLDIHPIQVVQDPPHEAPKEDIPLVTGKRTIVRVFVELPEGVKALADVTCKLRWIADGKAVATAPIKAHLHRVGKRTWVIPDYQWGQFKATVDRGTPGKNMPFAAAGQFFAYNFTFGKGLEAPAATLTLKAELRHGGKPFGQRTEQSGNEFRLCRWTWQGGRDFTVKLVTYASRGKGPKPMLQNRSARMKFMFGKIKEYRDHFLALFPIPENRISVSGSSKSVLTSIGPPGVDYLAEPNSFTKSEERRFYDSKTKSYSADVLLLITNENFGIGPWGAFTKATGFVDGYTPVNSDIAHYIDHTASELTAPHEVGHQSRFFGRGHDSGSSVEDAWDAGAHLYGVPTIMSGRTQLMISGSEGNKLNWISVSEYKKLLKLMTR